jgi:hypothetical protein
MEALNDQRGASAGNEQLERQLAEKDEQLEFARTQLDAMKEMLRTAQGGGGGDAGREIINGIKIKKMEAEVEALKHELAETSEAMMEKDEQLALANTQLEAMKEMMRGSGAVPDRDGKVVETLRHELAQAQQVLADREEQLTLATAQLDAMKEMMRAAGGGGGGGDEEIAAMKEQMELSALQLQAMKEMLREANQGIPMLFCSLICLFLDLI